MAPLAHASPPPPPPPPPAAAAAHAHAHTRPIGCASLCLVRIVLLLRWLAHGADPTDTRRFSWSRWPQVVKCDRAARRMLRPGEEGDEDEERLQRRLQLLNSQRAALARCTARPDPFRPCNSPPKCGCPSLAARNILTAVFFFLRPHSACRGAQKRGNPRSLSPLLRSERRKRPEVELSDRTLLGTQCTGSAAVTGCPLSAAFHGPLSHRMPHWGHWQ